MRFIMKFRDIQLKQESFNSMILLQCKNHKREKKIIRFLGHDGFDIEVRHGEIDDFIVQLYKNITTPRSCYKELKENGIQDCVMFDALMTGRLFRAGYKPNQFINPVRHSLFNKKIICTYFLAAEDHGLIKIGKTKEITSRIPSIATMSPAKVTLCHAVVYRDDLEKKLHDKFASIRSHGEWFFAEPELISFIRNAKQKGLSYIVDNVYQK